MVTIHVSLLRPEEVERLEDWIWGRDRNRLFQSLSATAIVKMPEEDAERLLLSRPRAAPPP